MSKVFSSSELSLTGYFLFFKSVSVNSGDGFVWTSLYISRLWKNSDQEPCNIQSHIYFFSIFCCAICSSTGYFDHALNCCHMIGWLDICINKQLKRCAFTKIQQIAYASNHEQRHEHINWSLILYSSQCYAALPSRVNFNTHKSQTYFAFFFCTYTDWWATVGVCKDSFWVG